MGQQAACLNCHRKKRIQSKHSFYLGILRVCGSYFTKNSVVLFCFSFGIELTQYLESEKSKKYHTKRNHFEVQKRTFNYLQGYDVLGVRKGCYSKLN